MSHLLLNGRLDIGTRLPKFLSRKVRASDTQWSLRTFSSVVKKPYYITTPIFYPNASPHIGHLYTLVTGDVFARYQRLCRGLFPHSADPSGVKFLAGTDEHGMKIQKAAKKHFGISGKEREFCDSLSERFRDLGRRADVSNTMFVRTTSDEHRRAVEDVWAKLVEKGFIYKGNYSGWYSVTDECFYTDAQVTRISTASSPSASSTTTATFTSSQNPLPPPGSFQAISVETGSPVEWSEEVNYMFRLEHFTETLLAHYTSNPMAVYPEQYREDVLKTLRSGNVEDISVSRPRSRLEWGIQVPNDPTQTVYVWFDALLIYLTGSGYPWSGQVSKTGCWPADLQVIGKDILKFHAIYLPAIIKALDGLSYSSGSATSPPNSNSTVQLAGTILTHAHWTSSQKKMSKSLGNVADPLEAMEKWGVDVVRYYLMRIGGRWRDDVDWSSAQLDKHHKEIQAQLGNYFLRITSSRLSDRVQSAEEGQITLEKCLSPEMKALFEIDSAVDIQNPENIEPRFILNEDVDVRWSDVPRGTASPSRQKEAVVEYKREVIKVTTTGPAERPRFIQNEDVDVRWSEVPRAHPTASAVQTPYEPAAGPSSIQRRKGVDNPNYVLLKATLILPAKVHKHMETFEAGAAISEIMNVLRVANKTLTDIAPWSASSPSEVVHTTRIVALETMRVVGGCLEPFMPGVAVRIRDALNVDPGRGHVLSKISDPLQTPLSGEEKAKEFWEAWTGKNVKGIRLF
ncbi:tRNA synthetases class I (M)-domain-containing protein [Crepidotus variabilis]|uniref:Probable methionine--tRNA ligase, mitochondrial n=1 Tax=Crepidotus variabilis TaxID=179855 RepID=A0A9P6E8E2_9AGAR|nr:tRNA synthetases class I (M)-domain-containing protein [Crepidotus variabilis]